MATIIECYWSGCEKKKEDGTCGLDKIVLGKKPGVSANTDGCQNYKSDVEWFKKTLTETVRKNTIQVTKK